MKISEVVANLEAIKDEKGDLECLIEVTCEDMPAMVLCGEVVFEAREGYGDSVAFLE